MLSKHALLPVLLLLLLALGCAGPSALRHSRSKYAAAVQVTRNEQLLLNLVRLRYRDTPSFLELDSLATQFSFGESAGIAGTLKENSGNFNVLGLSAGFDASERPTASYTPLHGEDFVEKLITPIEEETIVLLTRSGWKGERVFRIAVQSLNGLMNLRRASGPTPLDLRETEITDARDFRDLVHSLEQHSEKKILRFNYESVEIPKSTAIPAATLTPSHAVEAAQHGLQIVHEHKHVSIDINKIRSTSRAAANYIDEDLLKNYVASVKKDGLSRPIRVEFDSTSQTPQSPFVVVGDDMSFEAVKRVNGADKEKFAFVPCELIDPKKVIVAGESKKLVMTWNAEHNEEIWSLGVPNLTETGAREGRYVLQIEPRSLMGAMYYLSHAICVPLEHQRAGLVVITKDQFGCPFDWSCVTGDLFCVKSSKHKPDCAAVAVKYRGYWFYIDDRHHSSKATFGLLMQLFELRASGGAAQGPVLTLPVGI